MLFTLFLALGAVPSSFAYPWVARMSDVDSSMLRRQQTGTGPGSQASCPNNPNHQPAAPISSQFPYGGAKDGKAGTGKGGYLVPHPDDPDHQFIAPGPNDIRGPCPGLNVAANHNFLPRDGIATFNELVDAQQNVYNVGHDLAVLLTVLGLTTTDGDIVTQKLSIGCDATPRTSFNPTLTGSEPGLDGHNKFEADSSLTRNDYFTHGGDNFNFNQTLFDMMTATTGGNYNQANVALYRYQRYQQSLAENPNFYFGPLALLLYGAASFLYELMPSGTNGYKPDKATISSFFEQEKLPDNWTNRVDSYTSRDVGGQILKMYQLYPVQFGGATGNGGFNGLTFSPGFKDGKLVKPSATSVTCLLYQMATERFPSSLNGVVNPTANAISFAAGKLNPLFANLGCPLVLT